MTAQNPIYKLLLVSLSLTILCCCRPQAYKQESIAMEPTIQKGGIVLVDNNSYRTQDPKRWDIVTFMYPKNTNTIFAQRIIGLPQETIQFRGTNILINGTNLDLLSVLRGYDFTLFNIENFDFGLETPYRISSNAYFVLGDNIKFANDSRYWGELPRKMILGKVILTESGVTTNKMRQP